MNYIDQINRAVDYIEDHLDSKIEIDSLAKRAGMSKWHFQKDRLSSIIPRKPAITLEYLNHLYGGITMEPVLKTFRKMKVIGIAEKINSVHDEEFPANFKTVPDLWRRFRESIKEIPELRSGKTVGLIDQINAPNEAESLEYVAGVVLDTQFDPPSGFVSRQIPGGEYAEFTHTGPVRKVNHTMNYIYGSWLPKSGRARGDGPEFSFRDEDFDPEADDCKVKILIPLKCR